MSKNITLNENTSIEKCPKCGNNTEFAAHSQQVSEDCCDIWIVCKCGYDPTADKSGSRLEDVWGTLDEFNILAALDVWNSEIVELAESIEKQST